MSIRRTSRRYLGQATDLSHEFQTFLEENPVIASGLATIGGLVVNAVMQSKYGEAIAGFAKKPGGGAPAAGRATAGETQAAPRPRPAKPAAAKAKAKPAAKKKARRAPRAAK
jgi:hypothetical protein